MRSLLKAGKRAIFFPLRETDEEAAFKKIRRARAANRIFGHHEADRLAIDWETHLPDQVPNHAVHALFGLIMLKQHYVL